MVGVREDADPLQRRGRLGDEECPVDGRARHPPLGKGADGQSNGLSGIPRAREGRGARRGLAAIGGVAKRHGRQELSGRARGRARGRRHGWRAGEMPRGRNHVGCRQDARQAVSVIGLARGWRGEPTPVVRTAPLPAERQAGPEFNRQGRQVKERAGGGAQDERLSRLELEIRVESGVFLLHPIGQCVEGSHSRLAASHSQERPDGQVGGCGRFVVDLNGQHVVALHQPLPRIEGHLLGHAALVQLGLVESIGPRVEGNRLVLHRPGPEHLVAVDERHAAVIVVEGQKAVHQAR